MDSGRPCLSPDVMLILEKHPWQGVMGKDSQVFTQGGDVKTFQLRPHILKAAPDPGGLLWVPESWLFPPPHCPFLLGVEGMSALVACRVPFPLCVSEVSPVDGPMPQVLF